MFEKALLNLSALVDDEVSRWHMQIQLFNLRNEWTVQLLCYEQIGVVLGYLNKKV